MKKFVSIGEFVGFLAGVRAALPAAQRAGLAAATRVVLAEAQSMPGTYQAGDEEGGFPDWAPLSAATLDGFGPLPGKIADGFAPPDNPLRRTGATGDSYQAAVLSDTEAAVGSNDPVAKYEELGTDRRGVPFEKGLTTAPGIPARSVLARAAFRKGREAATAAALPVLRLFTDNIPESNE